jgi:hypothetical protein
MTIDTTPSSVRAMDAPPITIPISVRLRANMASLARRPYPQAIAIYIAVRLIGVAVLAVMAAQHNLPLLDRLTAWDGKWYLDIANQGYRGIIDRTDAHGQILPNAPWAFFPLYPFFISLLAMAPGVSSVTAALALSLGAGIAAACALVRIGRLFYPHRPLGLILVALWAGAPMGIALSMTYTEALFTALAAWALVGVLERNWLLAGTCCIFAGLTRPTASVLVAVVVVAALIAAYRGRDRWWALGCALLSPIGLLGYWAAVAAQTGSLTGWWDLERIGWNTQFDSGVESVQFVGKALQTDKSLMQTMVALMLLAAIVLAVLTVTNRIPWPLAAYGIGVVVMVVCTAGLPWAKVRFLLPGFTLLIPIALGLVNRKPKTIVWSLAAWVLVGAWFSAHSLTGWQYSI